MCLCWEIWYGAECCKYWLSSHDGISNASSSVDYPPPPPPPPPPKPTHHSVTNHITLTIHLTCWVLFSISCYMNVSIEMVQHRTLYCSLLCTDTEGKSNFEHYRWKWCSIKYQFLLSLRADTELITFSHSFFVILLAINLYRNISIQKVKIRIFTSSENKKVSYR